MTVIRLGNPKGAAQAALSAVAGDIAGARGALEGTGAHAALSPAARRETALVRAYDAGSGIMPPGGLGHGPGASLKFFTAVPTDLSVRTKLGTAAEKLKTLAAADDPLQVLKDAQGVVAMAQRLVDDAV